MNTFDTDFIGSLLLGYSVYVAMAGRWLLRKPHQKRTRPRWFLALWSGLSIGLASLLTLRAVNGLNLDLIGLVLPSAGLALIASLCMGAAVSLIYRSRINNIPAPVVQPHAGRPESLAAAGPQPVRESLADMMHLLNAETQQRRRAEHHLLSTYRTLRQTESRLGAAESRLADRQQVLVNLVRSLEAEKQRHRENAQRDAHAISTDRRAAGPGTQSLLPQVPVGSPDKNVSDLVSHAAAPDSSPASA